MKHLFMILAIGAILVGCKEKIITIKEFKENDTLRAEWMKKCAKENGFYEGSCRNAEEADRQVKVRRRIDALEKMGY